MDAAEKPLEALLLSINACRRQLESSSEDFARIAGRYSADIERDVRLLEETIEQVTYELRELP